MLDSRYIDIKNQMKDKGPDNILAFTHILIFSLILVLGVHLSNSSNLAVYIVGQLTLVVSYFTAQTLTHELGHGHFFKGNFLNDFFGHLVALVAILPYSPWKYIHAQHHRWTGNRYQDPTMVDVHYDDIDDNTKKIVNFCWKTWIPLLSLGYSFGNFWNYRKLSRMFPRYKVENLFSILIQFVFYILLCWIVGPRLFLKIWGPSYLIFLAVSEPLLLAQHAHIDQGEVQDPDFNENKQYHPREHDKFSRTVLFPKVISRWVLHGFDRHAIHHIFPNLPSYRYDLVGDHFPNTIKWYTWLKLAKKTPGATLLFKTNHETGLLEGTSC